jgi:hypothetical protein
MKKMKKPESLFHKLINEFVTEYPIPDTISQSFPHVRNLQRYHPGLRRFTKAADNELTSQHTFYTEGRLISWEQSGDNKNMGKGVIEYSDGTRKTKNVYVKTIHLLDPFAYISGEYDEPPLELPAAGISDNTRKKKLLDPNNQAYIDVTAMTILSRLSDVKVTPHVAKVYGAVCGVQDIYMYNITNEYDTLKTKRWFWETVGENSEKLHVIQVDGVSEAGVSEETIKRIRTCPFPKGAVEITEVAAADILVDNIPLEEIKLEADAEGDATDIQLKARTDNSSQKLGSEVDDDNDDADTLPYKIMVECKDMPVILLFEEAADGTLEDLIQEDINTEDSLLEDIDSDADDALVLFMAEKEERWSAWMMQVICALTQLQNLLGLCHNDLHTYNILWEETNTEYIYYKTFSGEYWKVPTYGKIMKVIDFGRATFRVGKKEFMSDDFMDGNEACGQYNYGPCYCEDEEIIPSNPSFDLCRLSVSMIDSLYVETPSVRGKKKSRKVMSEEEDGWIKYYTESDLYNCLWKWLIDDGGENVLRYEDGEDKYPGFDLYVYIASNVHGAVPKKQLEVAPFREYKLECAPDKTADGLVVSLYF